MSAPRKSVGQVWVGTADHVAGARRYDASTRL